jgi:hypothetical protein
MRFGKPPRIRIFQNIELDAGIGRSAKAKISDSSAALKKPFTPARVPKGMLAASAVN